jgi:hypothetical protein
MSAVQIRVRRIRNFFIRFEANLSKYGSSSLHIRMVSVYSETSLQTGECLLQNICLEANICKTLSKFHIQANIRLQIFAYQRMFAMYCFKYFGKPFKKS